MIVVDTNVISYLLLPGEFTEKAQSAFNKDSAWIAPLLWKSEFRNILSLYIHTKKMTLDQALALIEEAENVMGENEYQVDSNLVLKLAANSKCSAYDCEFVALASLLELPLVTSDKRILKEFPDIAISLIVFA